MEQRVLVVEDVWTTGGSTREAIRVVEEAGGRVVAAGALIDRSGGTIQAGSYRQGVARSCDPELPAEGLSLVRGGERGG